MLQVEICIFWPQMNPSDLLVPQPDPKYAELYPGVLKSAMPEDLKPKS